MARAGSMSLKSASRSSSVEIGSGEEPPAKVWSNHHHSTIAMWRTSPSSVSVEGGTPGRASAGPSSPSHFHSNVARW